LGTPRGGQRSKEIEGRESKRIESANAHALCAAPPSSELPASMPFLLRKNGIEKKLEIIPGFFLSLYRS
jgi:hypothetical protein